MKKPAKNLIYLISGDLGSRLLGFITVTYLARTLGVSGFGKINIGLSILAYAMLIGGIGLPILGTREAARKRGCSPTFIGNLILVRFITAVISFIFLSYVSYLIYNDEITYLINTYLLYIFTTVFFLDWYFQATEYMGAIALGKFIGMAVYLTLVFLVIKSPQDYLYIGWAWLGQGIAFAFFLGFVYAKKGFKIAFKIDQSLFKMLKDSFTLSSTGILTQLVLQSPVLFLSWYGSNEEIGFFNIAFRLVLLALIIDRVFYMMFFPLISREYANRPEKIVDIFTRFLKIVTILSIFITLLIFLFSTQIILFFFGDAYSASIAVLKVLSLYFLLTLTLSVFSYTLIGIGKEKELLKVIFMGAVVYFILIYPFYEWLNVKGIAFSIILNEFLILFMLSIRLNKVINFPILKTFIIPIISTFILLMLNNVIEINMILKILINFGLVLPVLIWIIGFRKEDFLYFKRSII